MTSSPVMPSVLPPVSTLCARPSNFAKYRTIACIPGLQQDEGVAMKVSDISVLNFDGSGILSGLGATDHTGRSRKLDSMETTHGTQEARAASSGAVILCPLFVTLLTLSI